MKNIFLILLSFIFIQCKSPLESGESKNLSLLKVGVTNGPHADVMEFVKTLAAKEGLEIKIVTFDDFILPNTALENHDIDVNIYQHVPYLEEDIQSRHLHIKALAKSLLLPMGVYGGKGVTSVHQIKDGDKVLIPSDPSNAHRALMLLQKAGLIVLKAKNTSFNLQDVERKSVNFKIVEVDAPLLPRLLSEDAALAVINTDWVIVSKLDPRKALLTEDVNSPFTNVMAVHQNAQKKEDLIAKFVKIYQSEATKEFIKNKFHGAVLSTW